MDLLSTTIETDATLCGVTPAFLGPFTRRLQTEYAARTERFLLPVLLAQHTRVRKTAARDMFENQSKSKYAALLCEFFELSKDFGAAGVPYAWYVSEFKREVKSYMGVNVIEAACEDVITDWERYRDAFYRALGPGERQAIELENGTRSFLDVLSTLPAAQLFSNGYVRRIRSRFEFDGLMTNHLSTLGYPHGPWTPPAKDAAAKSLDRDMMPRRADMMSFALNLLVTLTRRFVTTRLHDLSAAAWRQDSDNFFGKVVRHIELVEHLSPPSAIYLDKETENDLYRLLYNPQTSSVQFSAKDDVAFGLADLQPEYRTVRNALIRVYAHVLEARDALASGRVALPESIRDTLSRSGHACLRGKITALQKKMDEKRDQHFQRRGGHSTSEIISEWSRMRNLTIVAATPVSKDTIIRFVENANVFMNKAKVDLLKGSNADPRIFESVNTALAGLESRNMAVFGDLVNYMLCEQEALWHAYEIADTLAVLSAAPVAPAPPPSS